MNNLVLRSVSKAYKDGGNHLKVLSQVNFEAQRGELVGIFGPSGSGKSTLLSIIGALMTPDSGEVLLNNQDISLLSDKNISNLRAKEIGFIFQESQLLSYLNVIDQLKVVSINKNKKLVNDRAYKLLKDLGLQDKSNSFPYELSGGERQRVAVARAFINNPSIILADEPTSHLDDERGKQVIKMIRKGIYANNKIGIVVTHDNRLLSLMDRAYILENQTLNEMSIE